MLRAPSAPAPCIHDWTRRGQERESSAGTIHLCAHFSSPRPRAAAVQKGARELRHVLRRGSDSASRNAPSQVGMDQFESKPAKVSACGSLIRALARLPELLRVCAHRCSACSTLSPVLDQSRTNSWRENRPHPPERLRPPVPGPLVGLNARACIAPPSLCVLRGYLRTWHTARTLDIFTPPSKKHARPKNTWSFFITGDAHAVGAHKGPALAGAEGRPKRPRTCIAWATPDLREKLLHTKPAELHLSSTTSRIRSSQPPDLR